MADGGSVKIADVHPFEAAAGVAGPDARGGTGRRGTGAGRRVATRAWRVHRR
jgi:hypothetical protein